MFKKREVDLNTWYPDFVRNSIEFKDLSKTENIELNLFWDRLYEEFNNIIVDTANDETLEKLEKEYGLTTISKEIEARKFAIKAKRMEHIIYTEKTLIESLNTLTETKNYRIFRQLSDEEIDNPITPSDLKSGEDLYTIVYADKYILSILPRAKRVIFYLYLTGRTQELSIKKLFEEALPLNIELEYRIRFNMYIDFEKLSYREIEAYKFEELKEVII